MLRQITRSSLLLISALICADSSAEELRWYDVEVIAFSQKSGEYLNAEVWPTEWDTPTTEQALDFENNTHRLFRQFSGVNNKLLSSAKKIEDSSRYELLLYTSWRQAGLPLSKTRAVRIRSEREYDISQLTGQDEFGNDIFTQSKVPALDGTIKIELSRFLHIHADLLYQAPIQLLQETISATDKAPEKPLRQRLQLATESAEHNYLQGFPLQARRKTRSKEIQYIDHPMYGLVVLITPVES